jgi:hypothetical protein
MVDLLLRLLSKTPNQYRLNVGGAESTGVVQPTISCLKSMLPGRFGQEGEGEQDEQAKDSRFCSRSLIGRRHQAVGSLGEAERG